VIRHGPTYAGGVLAARRLSPALQLWRLVQIIDMPVLFVGGIAAAAGQRWGAYVLVAYLIVRISSHLAAGAWGYLEVMSRPWPEVPVLTDDPEWDD
jgi:hypothetical protein